MPDKFTEITNHLDRRNHFATFLLHALFICIIFVLPEAILRVAIPDRTIDITWPMYAKSIISISVFYISYFFIVPQVLKTGTFLTWKFILSNLLLIFAGAFLIWLIYNRIYKGPRFIQNQTSLTAFSYIIRDASMLVLCVALAVGLRVANQWRLLGQRHQKLLAARRQSELEGLRSQLNPHFLFNTLNGIYALIAISPDRAQKAVHQLSSLLRYLVYENPMTVSINSEIEFINDFVELMKLRMPNRPIGLSVDITGEPPMEIAPLIIMGTIGNAFKHGNTSDPSKPIDITITADCHKLKCTARNHTDHNPTNVPEHGGVGLANLRRRLELIYGDNATLSTHLSADGIFTTTLTVTGAPNLILKN